MIYIYIPDIYNDIYIYIPERGEKGTDIRNIGINKG